MVRLQVTYSKSTTSEQQRHDQISDWVFEIIGIGYNNPTVFIEDYSFGSKGRVFNLAENTGLLKHKLYKKGIRFYTLVPSVIKKTAHSKGNADKEKMYDKFYEETGINLMEELDQTTLNNPVTDIVDSYYISKVGYEEKDFITLKTKIDGSDLAIAVSSVYILSEANIATQWIGWLLSVIACFMWVWFGYRDKDYPRH